MSYWIMANRLLSGMTKHGPRLLRKSTLLNIGGALAFTLPQIPHHDRIGVRNDISGVTRWRTFRYAPYRLNGQGLTLGRRVHATRILVAKMMISTREFRLCHSDRLAKDGQHITSAEWPADWL